MPIYLVRHASTIPIGPDARRWPLSPIGEAEARQLAQAAFWKDIDALYSSPEEKAVETVRIAARKHGLEIRLDERLREVRRAPGWADDYHALVRRYLEEPDNPPEGWEPVDTATARMVACIRDIECNHDGERVAVCGHGLAFALLLQTLEGVDASAFATWQRLGFGQVAVAERGQLLLGFGEPERLGLVVRHAEQGDFVAVTTLLAELGRPPVPEEEREAARQLFERHVESSDVESLIVLRDGTPVGFLSLHVRERLNQPTMEAWIPDLIVTESEHGSGAARLLFGCAVDVARERGCHRLVLESGHARKRAYRFYEREGMRETGKTFAMELR
jgi:broad specificity phosphatase PhoE/GNAT superfamily N-acetyltransferase